MACKIIIPYILLKIWKKTSKEHVVVLNTFAWQRLEVVCLNSCEEHNGDGPNKAKRARLENPGQTQMLHDGSEIGV